MTGAWDWGLGGQAPEEAARARTVWEKRRTAEGAGPGTQGGHRGSRDLDTTRVEGLPGEWEGMRETSKSGTTQVQFSETVCFGVTGRARLCLRKAAGPGRSCRGGGR